MYGTCHKLLPAYCGATVQLYTKLRVANCGCWQAFCRIAAVQAGIIAQHLKGTFLTFCPSLASNVLKIIKLFYTTLPLSTLLVNTYVSKFFDDYCPHLHTSQRHLEFVACTGHRCCGDRRDILETGQMLTDRAQKCADVYGDRHRQYTVSCTAVYGSPLTSSDFQQ